MGLRRENARVKATGLARGFVRRRRGTGRVIDAVGCEVCGVVRFATLAARA